MSAWRPTPSPLAILGGWPAWREPLSARSGTSQCHPSSPGVAGSRDSVLPGGRLPSGGAYFILADCIFKADRKKWNDCRGHPRSRLRYACVTNDLLVITTANKIFPIIRRHTSQPCCNGCHRDDCMIGMPRIWQKGSTGKQSILVGRQIVILHTEF